MEEEKEEVMAPLQVVEDKLVDEVRRVESFLVLPEEVVLGVVVVISSVNPFSLLSSFSFSSSSSRWLQSRPKTI